MLLYEKWCSEGKGKANRSYAHDGGESLMHTIESALFLPYKVTPLCLCEFVRTPLGFSECLASEGNRIKLRSGLVSCSQAVVSWACCLLSRSESYRVRFFAARNRPGREAMTGDIRYVSPITQTVCAKHRVPGQDKWLPVRLRVGVCICCWCSTIILRYLSLWYSAPDVQFNGFVSKKHVIC